jgi:hypothetical protein
MKVLGTAWGKSALPMSSDADTKSRSAPCSCTSMTTDILSTGTAPHSGAAAPAELFRGGAAAASKSRYERSVGKVQTIVSEMERAVVTLSR